MIYKLRQRGSGGAHDRFPEPHYTVNHSGF